MSVLGEFHFLRPLWLLALIALAWMVLRAIRSVPISPWQRVCDPELLRALQREDPAPRRWLWILGCMGGVIGILALAGPSWQRLPQPLFETGEARVLVLDLSRSMDAQDVRPSRLAEARAALTDLLDDLPGGRFGLVAFAGSAFTVCPLTDDRRTVKHLLSVLTTDLMPVAGGRVAAGIEQGLSLLENGAAVRGDLIVLTDSAADEAARSAARAAAAAGHRLWVIGVGTPGGAPVPVPGGGLLTDRDGAPVLPVLDEAALTDLAEAGGGHYQRLSDAGLRSLRHEWTPPPPGSAADGVQLQTDAWRDEGRWLVLLLLPLAALSFRRGWLAAACLVVHVLPANPAHAQESADRPGFWQSRNQFGMQLLEAKQFDAAARAFADPRWRGVALYRAGAYEDAIRSFAQGTSATDHYNRGNALARARRLNEAVAAYDSALALAPDMEDARFNRALVKSLLPQAQQDDPQQGGAQPNAKSDSAAAGPGSAASAESSGDERGATSQESGQGQNPQTQQSTAQSDGQRTNGGAGAQAADAGEVESPQSRPSPGGNTGITAADANPSAQSGPPERTDAANEPWLGQVEDDPGGLLRRKFLRQQERQGVPPEVETLW